MHIDVAPEIVGEREEPTVTVPDAVAVFPPASLIVTVYVVLEVGQTFGFAPLNVAGFQEYVKGAVPPVIAGVRLVQPPWHIEGEFNVALIGELQFTTTIDEEVQLVPTVHTA